MLLWDQSPYSDNLSAEKKSSLDWTKEIVPRIKSAENAARKLFMNLRSLLHPVLFLWHWNTANIFHVESVEVYLRAVPLSFQALTQNRSLSLP